MSKKIIVALTSTVLAAGMVIASQSARADTDAIPEAPVLSVVQASQTLPFTLAGGGAIQIAVLTGDETVDDATWVDGSSLALAPYDNQDIEVLARAEGVTDVSDYFDAHYSVRDAFSPAVGVQTNPNNPVVATAGNDPIIRGWATSYSDYQPGPNASAVFQTPQNAIGPIGGSGYPGNTGVVSLGDNGTINMHFGSPIDNGPGYDFAVYENGFRLSSSGVDFIEIAYIEVSTDGSHWARFDSAATNPNKVGGFSGSPDDEYEGVAGRDLNGYGTPFDLSTLSNQPEVRDGDVDLNDITEVKVVDIKGDGSNLDSFGNPLFDPTPTAGSGGFDLRGVGVMNQQAAGVSVPVYTADTANTGHVTGSVSPGGDGGQSVTLQWSQDAAHDDVTTAGTGSVAATDYPFDSFTWPISGIVTNKNYWYRVVATDSGNTQVVSPWELYSTIVPATIVLTGVYQGSDTAAVEADISPGTTGDLTVSMSVSRDGSTAKPRIVDKTMVSGALATSDVLFPVSGLTQGHQYDFVITATDANGTQTTSKQTNANLPGDPPVVGTPIVTVKATSASITSTVNGNSYGPQSAHLEYSTNADGSNAKSTKSQTVGNFEAATLTFSLPKLVAGQTYYVRVVSVSIDLGNQVTATAWHQVTLGLPTATFTVSNPAPISVDGGQDTVQASGLEPGEYVTILLHGKAVGTGTADSNGDLTATFPVASDTYKVGTQTISVVGSNVRSGAATLYVVNDKTLHPQLSARTVHASGTETVATAGLAPGEAVTVQLDGHPISPAGAVADGSGDYVLTFPVGTKTGQHTVTVTGVIATRTGSITFTVG